jgi:asparagine synthase (glutamine-hydrolysing)
MGAVFGIVGDASPAELETMSERLAHRGSHAAIWSPAPAVHLGMRGTAAAVGQAEGGYLVFDGAIDNRTELATLINRSEPKGASPDDDPGLMRDLLRAVGKECLQHVAGQFALVMWDRAGEQLFLARDRIGYAPLYFTLEGARLIFASEYKALLAIPSVPARPNRNAIQVIQSTKWMQPGATCLEGIFPVAPGTWMAVEQNRLFTARFWDLPIQVRQRDERDHVAALRGAFLETLRRQTEPYHRIGISLSGGLDSAIMAGGVRHVAPTKEIHTFSAGHGPDDRELLNAERVAAELGTHHHPLILSPDDLPDLLPWMVWYMEEPIGREDIAYLYVVAREAARHVELILTGFGFDGLFAGLPRHRVADLALRAPAFAGPLREFYDYTVRSVEPSGVGGRALKQMYFRGSDYPAPQVKGAAPLEPLPGFNLGGDQPLSRFLRKGFLLLPYQSAVERLYTGSGVRFNAHHTDPAFLACAFSIPDRLKIKGRTQKYVLRKACAGLLSPSILSFGKSFNRLKHDLHLSNVLDGLAEQVLARDAVLNRGLFDPHYIADLRHRSGRTPYSQERAYRLWSLLLAEMWCRIYLDARGSPPGMAQG